MYFARLILTDFFLVVSCVPTTPLFLESSEDWIHTMVKGSTVYVPKAAPKVRVRALLFILPS